MLTPNRNGTLPERVICSVGLLKIPKARELKTRTSKTLTSLKKVIPGVIANRTGVIVVVGDSALAAQIIFVLQVRVMRLKRWAAISQNELFLGKYDPHTVRVVVEVVGHDEIKNHQEIHEELQRVSRIIYDPFGMRGDDETGYIMQGVNATPSNLVQLTLRMAARKRGPRKSTA